MAKNDKPNSKAGKKAKGRAILEKKEEAQKEQQDATVNYGTSGTSGTSALPKYWDVPKNWDKKNRDVLQLLVFLIGGA